jgi:hypothetical protein
MLNQIYIFEIRDADRKSEGFSLMLYKIKDSYLTPLISDFERGSASFPSFENIIEYLTQKKVNSLTTYLPHNLDTVCSQPYEIGDFTDYEIENGFDSHRFLHFEFSPTDKEKTILSQNNITINYLGENKIVELEKMLKQYY